MIGRLEDPPLIAGLGHFVEDLADRSTLWAGFVRSPVAHGRIRAIDTDGLGPDEGPIRVLLASDLAMDPQPGKLRESLPGHVDYRRPVLADDVVRFEGEAVALVVAKSEAALADALERVWVEIEDLPAVLTLDDALTDTTVLHPLVGTNLAVKASFTTGEVANWTDGSPFVDLVVESPRVAPVPLEPLGILVAPTGDRFEVTCGTQTPHRLRQAIAQGLGVGNDRVRVVVPEVGGAFGQKGAVYVEYLAIARAAQLLGRTVIWIQRRRDNLRAATHGRGMRHHIRLGGTPDGRLTHAEIEVHGDLGAYPQMGGVVPLTSAAMAAGPYRFDGFSVTAIGLLTNLNPTGPYRGAGRPEATFALERAIDAFARSIGVDAVEVRRRSLLPAHRAGATSGTGLIYDSGDYLPPLELAARLIDPAEVKRERERRLGGGGSRSLGAGITCFVERAGGPAEFGEFAALSLEADGTLDLRVGTAPSGQGHRSVFTRIVADVFSVDPAIVSWEAGDTDVVPSGGGTYGSRSGQLGGSATSLAALDLADQCRALAADVLEASPDDLVGIEGGFAVAGVPGTTVSLHDVATVAVERGIALRSEVEFVAPAQTFPHGAHGAVVEVDLETGDVQLLRAVAVDDCGVVLDPMIVAGQVHGSMAQGAGQAMQEVVVHSAEGGLLTGSLMDYLIPTATDLPSWEVHHLVTPSPTNPLGSKGIGESGTIGLPAAIVNAVLDALSPLGVLDVEMPVTPARVWSAIRAAAEPRK